MGYMERLRSLAPWFILGVGGIFILFMVVSDMNFSQLFTDRGTIGEIDGEKISAQEFEEFYQQYLNQLRQSGQEPDHANDQQTREQAWNQFVMHKLVEKAYKKYGITATDEEIHNVIWGDSPPQFLTSSFMDSNGVFNRAAYENALRDPRNKENLIMVEDAIRQDILAKKLQALVTAGIVVTEPEIKRKFIDENIKMNAQYVLVDVNVYPDSLVKFTDDDLKEYYNKNSYLYKQEADRKLKYVVFNIQPSSKDSLAVQTILKNILKKIESDSLASFQSFVEAQSDLPYSKDTVHLDALPPALQSMVGKLKAGQIVGPLAGGDEMGLYKIDQTINGDSAFARASHILLEKTGDDAADLEAATKLYNDLKGGKNFEQTAKAVSKDPGSAANGGDLGWFPKGRMVKPFEDACFNGPVGEVQPPVKTEYGYHIIKVTNRSSEKFVIEKIVKKLTFSPQTATAIRREAEDFRSLAESIGLDSAAKTKNLAAMETQPFTEKVSAVPGVGYSKALVVQAFKEGLNDFLPVTTIDNRIIVAQITEVNTDGVKKFDSVKEEVKAAVIREKKFELALTAIKNIKSKTGGDLSKAPSIDKNARFGVADSFTLAGNISGLGMDYAFSYNAYKAKPNTISEPVKGLRGYYLIKLTMRENFNEQDYLSKRVTIRDQMLNERRQTASQLWMQQAIEDANVKYYPQN
ncbi:MAG: peptidylprolyl isomerase [Ignavibacteriales bacterium]|nr:MAG: hypothetical protein F9K26_10515 [Ignavibacteriaceae bacterium]MBW7873611.1 peptidylprolyl isomerase [Ignavibacteria bacterium]MCZ2143841.1 peptidylprolyl isomerase [Ignavibacteriales bacterium]OQY75757.1 MAG: hypothetical protein B6D45_05230 [Ignavibacteriales bacterium UTCHB3]MBV6445888.1 Chaperone SurA [Ignavibacteriaceae bacterium]